MPTRGVPPLSFGSMSFFAGHRSGPDFAPASRGVVRWQSRSDWVSVSAAAMVCRTVLESGYRARPRAPRRWKCRGTVGCKRGQSAAPRYRSRSGDDERGRSRTSSALAIVPLKRSTGSPLRRLRIDRTRSTNRRRQPPVDDDEIDLLGSARTRASSSAALLTTMLCPAFSTQYGIDHAQRGSSAMTTVFVVPSAAISGSIVRRARSRRVAVFSLLSI